MADDTEAAESARAQAEARRKRILERAQKRMGQVSGEAGQDHEDKEQSASNAARIRAARQRRYGRKSKAADAEKSTTTEQKEDDETKTEQEPVSNKESVEVSQGKTLEKSNDESPPAQNVEVAASSSVDEASAASEPKKKYVGVARMRRKMILKKKNENEEDKDKEMPAQDSSGVDFQAKALPKSTRNSIYMHVVTILLLFVAGFDIGLDQFHQDVRVHHELVFKEVGIPLLRNAPSKLDENSLENVDIQNDGDLANEFDTSDEDETPGANIDPLFKVDLDELTKGPGFLNVLGRAALSAHRLLLLIFYFTPRSIIVSLLSLPQALVKNPPTLCLLALLLRQIVGKRILSAGIPGSEVEEKESGVDVVGMIKQGVTSWLLNAFPNAVGFYDAFSHLRSDMYIIICGVFFGLAWSHTAVGGDIPLFVSTATDEL